MFPHWTFWPSTVFTRRAAEDLVALWGDEELQGILARTKIWASEEVLLPSLVALSGHRVLDNPCTYNLVQYRATYTVAQLDAAMDRPSAFWAHPVPRVYGDPLRFHVRSRFGAYLPASGTPAEPFEAPEARPLPLLLPLIKRMEAVEGWLSPGEADLLAAAAARAFSELAAPCAIVEVGSYCGRATVVLGAMAKAVGRGSLVHAIDPHDGKLGARGEIVAGLADSSTRLRRHLEEAGLSGVVRHIKAYSGEVSWNTPIGLLVIDHLHDYASVAADFSALQRFVVDGGLVAFHDYGRFPGVTAFVDDLLATGAYASVQRIETLFVVRKTGSLALPALGRVVGQNDGHPEGSPEVDRDEAALLALAATRALAACSAGAIVEAGSPGPREGLALAAAADAAARPGPIHCATQDNAVDASGGLCLLVVGGGQDPESAAAGLRRFGNQVAEGGYVAVRECSDRHPAAVATVREALRGGAFEQAARTGSLMVLRKCAPHQAGDARDGTTVEAAQRGGPTRRGASDEPLVSCLMPTFDRRPFVPRAIRYFLQQDYPRSELIVVDDGTDSIKDLIPADPRIRYLRLTDRRTIGAKRNLACEHAAGELVVHWDDDDWSAPWRLRYQVEMLRTQDVDVSGLNAVFFCDMSAARAWRYEYPAGRKPWGPRRHLLLPAKPLGGRAVPGHQPRDRHQLPVAGCPEAGGIPSRPVVLRRAGACGKHEPQGHPRRLVAPASHRRDRVAHGPGLGGLPEGGTTTCMREHSDSCAGSPCSSSHESRWLSWGAGPSLGRGRTRDRSGTCFPGPSTSGWTRLTARTWMRSTTRPPGSPSRSCRSTLWCARKRWNTRRRPVRSAATPGACFSPVACSS